MTKLPLELTNLGAIFNAIKESTIISMTDLDGNIQYVNDKFVEISKYTRKELIGQNHRILKSGDQDQRIFDDLWKTISAGKVWRGELKNRAKDGTFYWVDTTIAPVLDEHGKPLRYISVRFLVTDRVQLQERVEQHVKEIEAEEENFKKASLEAKKFELAVARTTDHVVITDPDGIIVYANAGVMRMTGFSPDEILGKKAGSADLWGGLMDKEFYKNFWQTIKYDKKSFSGELKNKKKNGREYISSASVSPVLNDAGEVQYFVGIERDITHEKDVDRAKTEFVSIASHQLRMPIAAVGWNAEMLLDGDAGAITDEQKEYVREIYTNNRRMAGLVKALLNVSRLELGTFLIEPEPIFLSELIAQASTEMHQTISTKNLNLQQVLENNLPKINADPHLTYIVIQNLISNAVKYTPAHGHIAVALELKHRGSKVAGHQIMKDALLFSIEDTGYGIPQAQQGHIFTKLFRADNVKSLDIEGTGLGLYIVKSILDHSGGDIWFESVEGTGTTFYVTMPLEGMIARAGKKRID